MAATCVYCHGRKGKRSCPALNGLICSTCCGENRLTKIACPADCPYLEAGTDYQRQRVGELFRQDRRRVYREIFEIGGERAAGLFNLIEIVCFSYYHNKPSGLDGEVVAALEFIRRLLSPIHFPAPTVPAFSQYLHKEFKAFLSGTGLRSNRFLTGLIGCLTMDHPDVVAHLKKQETDQPRIVLAEDKDIAAAAKEQALREKSRIVIPGAHAHDHEHHGHKHS